MTTDLATKFTKMMPNCELYNLYSISECHDATIGDLKRDLDPQRKCGIGHGEIAFAAPATTA